MEPFVAAGAGFLLAVLWFDLMHDVQVRSHDAGADLPEPVLASIATYYARVTTGARPMNRLIALTMLVTLTGIVVEITGGLTTAWLPWTTPVLAVAPIGLAGTRTLPSAVRLGSRRDDAAGQSRTSAATLRRAAQCRARITQARAARSLW